jgi:hypothetical protein
MSNHRLPEGRELTDMDSSRTPADAAGSAPENPAPGPSAQPTGNDAVPDGPRANGHEIELTVGQRDLVEKIRAGQCILFLGAGVHAAPDDDPAQYPQEERPLLGGGLAEALAGVSEFAKLCPKEAPSDLQRVSLHIDTEKELGRAKLVEYLKGYLRTGKKPSKALRILSVLPFKIIVTTNYDSLLEMSLRQRGKDPKIVVYQPKENVVTEDARGDPTEQEPFVFKMHGDLDAPSSIVITDEDYIRFIQRMADKEAFHPVPQTVRYYMNRWPTLFIGYSLRDYNLRLLFRALRRGMDASAFSRSFSLDPRPDPLIVRVWQEREQPFVAFVVHDLWKFVPRLHREIMGKDFDG